MSKILTISIEDDVYGVFAEGELEDAIKRFIASSADYMKKNAATKAAEAAIVNTDLESITVS